MTKFLFMKLKIALVVAFLSLKITAQEVEPIQCDRPDQTETPSLVNIFFCLIHFQ